MLQKMEKKKEINNLKTEKTNHIPALDYETPLSM